MSPSHSTIGVLGFGVMGSSMALNLARHGHKVLGFSRSQEKVEALESSGIISATLPEIVAECSCIVLSLTDGPTVDKVLFEGSPSFVSQLKPDTLIIDTTTIAPQEAQSLASRIEKIGLHFVDAPVSGGDVGARNGTLTVMCGGSEESFSRAQPILECMGSKVIHVGPAGYGQKMKAVNQVAVALGVVAMTEALVFAKDQGLDLARVLEILQGGAAGSWALSNYAPRLLKDDIKPGFSAAHMLKDLKIALSEAEGETDLPGLNLATKMFADLVAQGGVVGNHALIRVYKPQS